MSHAHMTILAVETLRVMWFSVLWLNLKGGAGAVMTSSGMSAIHLVCTVFLKPGDLLVAPHDCYGGSYRLFDSLAKRGAYNVLFVDQGECTGTRRSIRTKT
jgi:cystathionine gamma-synthase